MNKNILLGKKVEAVKDNRPVVFCENGNWSYAGEVIKISVAPEVVLKREVNDRVSDYWFDTVIDSMLSDWFRIRMQDNKIIIEPVNVEPIEG